MIELPNDSDGDAIRGVISNGSDLSQPMDVEFQIAAPSATIAELVGNEATKLGFRVEISKDEGRDQFTANCTKSMLLSYKAVIDVQSKLGEIAIPVGAYPDGWGTFGNA